VDSHEFTEWLETVSNKGWGLFAKRLSGNDTGLTRSHQAGIYLPKPAAFWVLPELDTALRSNPDLHVDLSIDSHPERRRVRAVWYNSGSRDEARITQWGGRSSPLQDPEQTGALTLFAFRVGVSDPVGPRCRVWVCRSEMEEDLAREWLGELVEPDQWLLMLDAQVVQRGGGAPPGTILQADLPREWAARFPSGNEILDFVVKWAGEARHLPPDRRLLRRRELEFAVFALVERIAVLPTILNGFEDMDSFLAFAHSVTNRRKARAGRSLELHLRRIFEEEDVQFVPDARTEGGKRPDFLFPSQAAYNDAQFPQDRLRMLGVKTTLKDRWRQVLNEADRIDGKHLLTLQQGVSQGQFREMSAAGLTLVVPSGARSGYPADIRDEILDLSGFIREVRALV